MLAAVFNLTRLLPATLNLLLQSDSSPSMEKGAESFVPGTFHICPLKGVKCQDSEHRTG